MMFRRFKLFNKQTILRPFCTQKSLQVQLQSMLDYNPKNIAQLQQIMNKYLANPTDYAHLDQPIQQLIFTCSDNITTPQQVMDYSIYIQSIIEPNTRPILENILLQKTNQIGLTSFDFDQLRYLANLFSYNTELDKQQLQLLLQYYQTLFQQQIVSQTDHVIDDLFNLMVLKYGYQNLLLNKTKIQDDPNIKICQSLVDQQQDSMNGSQLLKLYILNRDDIVLRYVYSNTQQLNVQQIIELTVISNKIKIQQNLLQLIDSTKHLFKIDQLIDIAIVLDQKKVEDQQIFIELEREICLRDEQVPVQQIAKLAGSMLDSSRNKFFFFLENIVQKSIDQLTLQDIILLMFTFSQREMMSLEFYQLLERKVIENVVELDSVGLHFQLMLQASVFQYISKDSPLLQWVYKFNSQKIADLQALNDEQFLSFVHHYSLIQEMEQSIQQSVQDNLNSRIQKIDNVDDLEQNLDFCDKNSHLINQPLLNTLKQNIKSQKKDLDDLQKQFVYRRLKRIDSINTKEYLDLVFS